MASSSYESTPETTNTNRVSRVFLGPCTDGLRDILHHYVPTSTFSHVIKVNKKILPRLTADQRNLILPPHGSYTGKYSDMDISLLYILLRNITRMPPHSKGWNNEPDPNDRSLSANIERVRLIRNKCYGHSISASMSNTDFNSIWSDIRCVMIDVDAFLNNGNTYQKAVNFLRSESMDPELDQHYENELRKQVEEERTTRKMVVSLKSKLRDSVYRF